MKILKKKDLQLKLYKLGNVINSQLNRNTEINIIER